MASFPNQRIVTIHKPLYEKNFVQVDIDDWQEAFDCLTKSSFGLYLYCCGNMNGYKLGLSSAAVQNALHISDTSYRRAVEELLKKGYFIQNTTTKYDFYTSPQPTSYVPKPKKKKASDGGAAAPAFEEIHAAEPTQEPERPPFSSSPTLTRAYEWDE